MALIFTATVVGLSLLSRHPPEVTPRLLAADPDFYAGREVRVRTAGMEEAEGGLSFRFATNEPVAVVLRFRSSPPKPLSPVVTGTCLGRQGGVVIVLDCRP